MDGRVLQAIEFEAPHAPFGYFVEISTGSMTSWPERLNQPVILKADDQLVSVFNVSESGLYSLFCPPPAGSRAKLTFGLPGATRPADLRGGGDPRTLGLAVRRIRIMPLLGSRGASVRGRRQVAVTGRSVVEAVTNAERSAGMPVHELLTRFEMICGDCWFGLMQRALGSEPLSLLRFAGATPPVIISLLETDFCGIGENISPAAAGDGSDEWMIADAIGLNYHSGKSLAVAVGEVVAAERKKTAFLRRKLLDDLSVGDKIFLVVDRFNQPPETAMSIFLALRRVSSAAMLWVQPMPFGQPPGSVVELADGLFAGFLDLRAGPTVGGMPIGGWLSVLVGAAGLAAR